VSAAGEKGGETGLLGDDGAAGGEVATAPVAEPAGVKTDVLVFRDSEFAFGAADVIAIAAVVGAEVVRGAETPAVPEKFFARLVVLDVGGQLEGFTGAFRSGNEPDELTRFAPEILFAAPLDVFQSARGPVRDRSENRRGTGRAIRFPKIGHDGLAGREPLQIVRGNGEQLAPDIFAEGEEGVVALEIFEGRFVPLVDLDLFDSGVAFDVENPVTGQQVGIEFLGAADV